MSFGAALVLLLAGAVSPAFSQAAAPPANGYVGAEACKACHPTVVAGYYKNPHYKQMVAAKDDQKAEAGCESCHGPAKAHVEGRGLKSAIKAFSVMEPKAIL